MSSKLLRFIKEVSREQQGSFAVEFAIIMPVLLLLVFGITDFGHAWYMRQMMVNASREGARYGTRYKTDSLGNRVLPKNLSPSVSDFVLNTTTENCGSGGWGLKTSLPADSNPQVVVAGTAASESNPSVLAGEDLNVTVIARKNWLVLDKLIPGFGSYVDLQATTEMMCE